MKFELTPKAGRRIHLSLFFLWTVVGLPLSWYLKESVPWVVFLSVYAIIVTHLAGWSAERPTEVVENGKAKE